MAREIMRYVRQHGTLFMIAAFATIGLACSNDPSGDAGTDASDAGEAADADAGPEDVGPADVGECGCTFGYHQSCAPDQVCINAYSAEPMCSPTLPISGGCVKTSTPGVDAPCNAQCATSSYDFSPCGPNSGAIEGVIRDWFAAIENARMTPTGWERMSQQDIDDARSVGPSITPECVDFLGWTVVGLIELCRGAGTVRHFEPWDAIENISFKFLSSPADDCKIGAGQACESILRGGVGGGEEGHTIDLFIGDVVALCPSGLPFAAPCNGADAQDCIKTRLRTMIRTLHPR